MTRKYCAGSRSYSGSKDKFKFIISACLCVGLLYLLQFNPIHKPVQKQAAPAHAQHALRAYIDPVTGEFTSPPAIEIPAVAPSSALSSLTIKQAPQYKTIRLSNGTRMIELQEYYRPSRQPETPAKVTP